MVDKIQMVGCAFLPIDKKNKKIEKIVFSLSCKFNKNPSYVEENERKNFILAANQ